MEPDAGRPFTWVDGERRIRFGRGVICEAPELLAGWAAGPFTLLTTERAAAQAPGLVRSAAVVLHVPPGVVPDAAAALRPHVGDRPVVALGGGRVVDAAKAVAAVDRLPCAAVPTTLSGAELTAGHRLPAGVSTGPRVRPSLVVTDPSLAASQPPEALAASAANALAHAVEALYVPLANPLSELLALRGARLIGLALAPAEPDREVVALGALLAAVAMGQTGYAVHHVLSQSVVRRGGLPHAGVNAVVLPHTTRLMTGRAPRALAQLAEALGGPPEAAVAAVRVAELTARAGPTRLRDLEPRTADRDALLDGAVADAVARPELGATPDPPTREELRALLDAAW